MTVDKKEKKKKDDERGLSAQRPAQGMAELYGSWLE